jgi:hypothetical protein
MPAPNAAPTAVPEAAHDRESARRVVAGLQATVAPSAEPLPPTELADRLSRLAQALAFFTYQTTHAAVTRAATSTHDAGTLYRAGYELVGIGFEDLAIAPLAQALALDPGNLGTLLELAVALEGARCHAAAADLLAAHPEALDTSAVARALYSHDAAMAGDFAAVAAITPRVSEADTMGFLARLARLRLARHAALAPLSRPAADDLRAWELVLHGLALLHTSPEGAEVMHGRYGLFFEQADACASTLALLHGVLTALGRQVTAVVHTPERDSEILATALATRLGLPAPTSLAEAAPGPGRLVVAYVWPGSDINALRPWSEIPDAILYGHVLDWTRPAWLAPDIAGVEAQYVSPPWGEHLRVTPPPGVDPGVGRAVETVPPDDRPALVIGADLGAHPAAHAPGAEAAADTLDLLGALGAAGAGCGLLTGDRQRYYPGGPVASQRFV